MSRYPCLTAISRGVALLNSSEEEEEVQPQLHKHRSIN